MLDLNQSRTLTGLAERLVAALEKRNDELVEPASPSVLISKTGGDYIPMTVESFDNHVFYWAKVNTDRCLDLIKRIRALDNDLRMQHMSRMLPPEHPPVPIWLHIQSEGGELFTGLNVADQLRTINTPIYSIVEGVCASAATLISMACTRRYIAQGSFMLIHQLSSWGAGTYQQLQDDQHINDMLMNRLYSFYSTRTKLSKTKVKQLLSRDTWFDSNECLANGLVDEILTT